MAMQVVYTRTVSEVDDELHAKLKALTINGAITSPRRLREMKWEQKRLVDASYR